MFVKIVSGMLAFASVLGVLWSFVANTSWNAPVNNGPNVGILIVSLLFLTIGVCGVIWGH